MKRGVHVRIKKYVIKLFENVGIMKPSVMIFKKQQ